MFFFRRKKHEQEIKEKEALIQASNKKLKNKIIADRNKIERLNKILSNDDITLKIYRVIGHDN